MKVRFDKNILKISSGEISCEIIERIENRIKPLKIIANDEGILFIEKIFNEELEKAGENLVELEIIIGGV